MLTVGNTAFTGVPLTGDWPNREASSKALFAIDLLSAAAHAFRFSAKLVDWVHALATCVGTKKRLGSRGFTSDSDGAVLYHVMIRKHICTQSRCRCITISCFGDPWAMLASQSRTLRQSLIG